MAGITLADYFAHATLWRTLGQAEQPAALLNFMARFPRIAGIGAAVLICTGFGMMFLTHGVFGEQLWFRIKFGLVILLILNALVEGRRQSGKLHKLLAASGTFFTAEMEMIKSRLNRFHLVQLLLFLLIIF
ncbi:hypothetical protein [Mucilaginibacter ginsenosidivorax]|uniref:DUF2214 family protein n=1 Tax=Mucilaginibacter ginsenosidivorax TaxID=862126 RepID=A0A5B8VWM0_9SPHI|nr:hypothetical protein [Mucilaginibacter ginsenosidivorax]QEC74638.1 hypothetical protein FSB76_01260 [Mucilaginibacter ginsenosidivorax]